MQVRRLIVATAASATLGSLPLLIAVPPAHAADNESRIVLDDLADVHRYGDRIRIAGQVQARSDDGPWGYVDIDDDQVTLERRVAGVREWTPVGGRAVADDGRFAFRVRAKESTRYRVRYAGSELYLLPGSTVRTRVRVAPRLRTRAVADSRGRIHLLGRVRPGLDPRPVVIQRKTCAACEWHRWRRARTDQRGRFRVEIFAPVRGGWFFRAVAPADAPRFVTARGRIWRTFPLL